MPFPTDDRAWNDTLLYLLERRRPGERTLAPDEFADELPFVRPYSQRDGRDEPSYAWAVVHKGMTETLGAAFLRSLPGWAVPVFANDVFVVFAREPGFAMTDLSDSDHVKSLFASLPDGEAAAPAEPPAAAPEAPAAPAAEEALAEADEPSDGPEPEQPPTPRPAPTAPRPAPAGGLDRLREQEIARLLRDHVGDASGLRVLDLGCGAGRFGHVFAEAKVVGVDADAAAIDDARARHAGLPNFRFVAAAPDGALGEAPFDATLLVDSLPAQPDEAARWLDAAAAATRPGGLLFLSAPNRTALDRLGSPATATGHSLEDVTGLLRAAGFRPLRAEGVVLPWPAPIAEGGAGQDAMLEALRELGRLAGPAYAQAFVVVARRG